MQDIAGTAHGLLNGMPKTSRIRVGVIILMGNDAFKKTKKGKNLRESLDPQALTLLKALAKRM